MTRLALTLAAALALGCVSKPTDWQHPTKSEAELNRDYADCMSQGAEAQANAWNTPAGDPLRREIYKACMRGRGYELAE